MRKLFGTDGIRGVANKYPMTPEMALTIGRAVAVYFGQDGEKAKIVIGKDTRISGDMLESALVAGICSMGTDAYRLGTFPTPGIAVMTDQLEANAGIVISASHNPFDDNGLKVFKKDGYKLSDKEEEEIEDVIFDQQITAKSASIRKTGRVFDINDADSRYRAFLMQRFPDAFSLAGMKIVLDCSNGATYRIAPELFAGLGADVESLFISPNGVNINKDCGSQHLEALMDNVKATGADIGFAFDGDGDRVVAVDDDGKVVTGDQILAICGKFMKEEGTLRYNRVVSTVMSNFGLGYALQRMGIDHIVADVGDRYVLEKMISTGAVLGGEDSGHVIFLDNHTTGDGMLAALKLTEAMQAASKPLSQLCGIMTLFPQVLINVAITQKPDLNTIPEVVDAIQSVEAALTGKGRVLVRYSGTQSLCRIMVEGPDRIETERHCRLIADTIKEAIGQ